MLSYGNDNAVAKTFLLTGEFPPMQTGIARMMGEVTRRYPRGELLVSTGQHRDSQDSDVSFSGAVVDRLPVPSRALRNLAGLLFWARRVAGLARQHKPRFAWCDSIRPCTYPAKWMHERVGTKYGVFVHGGDLLKELHAIHHSRFARKTAKALLGSAVAVVANSQWTREQAQKVLRELGLDPLAETVRLVPLGTDPEQFRPGIDTRAVRERYGLNGGAWVLTVARLEPYKGVDMALRAVALCRNDGLEVNYLVVGSGKKRKDYQKLAGELHIADHVPCGPDFIEVTLEVIQPEIDRALADGSDVDDCCRRATRAANDFLETLGTQRRADAADRKR